MDLNVATPVDRSRRPCVAAERLAIRPRGNPTTVDLVPRDPVGAPPAATLRVPRETVLLDALRWWGGDHDAVIYASEFDATSQVGRVRRWTLGADGEARAEDVLVGAPGEVLWWLHVRDDALRVREIGRGTSYVVVGTPGARARAHAVPSARGPRPGR